MAVHGESTGACEHRRARPRAAALWRRGMPYQSDPADLAPRPVSRILEDRSVTVGTYRPHLGQNDSPDYDALAPALVSMRIHAEIYRSSGYLFALLRLPFRSIFGRRKRRFLGAVRCRTFTSRHLLRAVLRIT